MANQWDIRAQMANSKDHTKQPVNRRLSFLIILRWDSSVGTALTVKAHMVVVIGGQHNSLGVPHSTEKDLAILRLSGTRSL